MTSSHATSQQPRSSPTEKARAVTEDSFELDAIKKVNEMRKQNQEKETKRETVVATHATTLSSDRKLVRKNAQSLVRQEKIASYFAFKKSERSTVSPTQPTHMCSVTRAYMHFDNLISFFQSDAHLTLKKSAAGQKFVN